MIPITIAPNVNSAPPTQLPPAGVDEWQLYSHALDRHVPPGCRLLVEAGAVKEGDRCDGAACRAELRDVIGTSTRGVRMVSLDEPLVAAVRPFGPHGYPWPHGHCVDKDQVDVVTDRIADYLSLLPELGLEANWIISSQQHPINWTLDQIGIAAYKSGVAITRLTVDWNPYAQPAELMALDIHAARLWCQDAGIELAAIVMAHPPHGFRWPSDPTRADLLFFGYAYKHYAQLAAAGPWDRFVVQSWVHHDAAVPHRESVDAKTIPSTDTLLGVAGRIAWMQEHRP